MYKNTVQLLKLKALGGGRKVDLSAMSLTFGLTYYTVTCENKRINIPYSPNYTGDIELIYQMLTFGMDNRILESTTHILDTENFDILDSNTVIQFIVTKLDEIKYNNLVYWGIDHDIIETLHKISTRLKSCITYKTVDRGLHSDVCSYGLITSEKYSATINDKYVMPVLLTSTCLLKGNDRKFFISDLNAMSDVKLTYYVRMLTYLIFCDDMNVFLFAVTYVKNKFPYITTMINNLPTAHKRIVDSFPNCIDKFPFKSLECYIPSLSAYPVTMFQWLITNYISRDNISQYSFETNNLPNSNDNKSIRDYTDALLPFISCDEKAMELYCEYMRIDADSVFDFYDSIAGVGMKGFLTSAKKYGYTNAEIDDYTGDLSHPSNDTYAYEHIRNMFKFIADGAELYKQYTDPITCDDGYVIKLVPVEGSLLKRVRNSIFNHNEEKKISIEGKLKFLSEGDMMPCTVELSPTIEQIRIKTKRHLIYSGKELSHCIGGKTDSSDLFFREGTVCAQVGIKDKKISVVECRDKSNAITENSNKLKAILEAECILLNEKYADTQTEIFKDKHADYGFIMRNHIDNVLGEVFEVPQLEQIEVVVPENAQEANV